MLSCSRAIECPFYFWSTPVAFVWYIFLKFLSYSTSRRQSDDRLTTRIFRNESNVCFLKKIIDENLIIQCCANLNFEQNMCKSKLKLSLKKSILLKSIYYSNLKNNLLKRRSRLSVVRDNSMGVCACASPQ